MSKGSEKPADDISVADAPADDDLGFSMPAFKVPTESNDAVKRDEVPPVEEKSKDLEATQTLPQETLERIKREYVDETRENEMDPNAVEDDIVFDREELVRTRDMRAFSRSESIKHLKIEGWLKDQRFAPDILVRPPRVLTKKWQEGSFSSQIKEKPIELAEEGSKLNSDSFSDIEDDAAMAAKLENAATGEYSATDLQALAQLESEHMEIDEAEMDEVEIDEVEMVTPPAKPPVQPPPPRPAKIETPDDDLKGMAPGTFENNKPKIQPHHPTGEEDRRSGWCHTLFDEEYLRTLPRDLKRETAREVKFLKDSLGLQSGARVLDLACGFGRHAVELAQDGLEVAGLDLSIDLLQHALSQAKKRNLSIKFIHGDMRELNFSEIFDGCFCWQTSFGYFNDRTNISVLEGVNRSLKMGGRFVIDTINRDHIVAQMPTRTWWEGIDCVFLEEVEFDFSKSILNTKRSFIYDGAPPREYKSHIRLYSLHELKRILGYCGFRVIEVSGEIHHRGSYLGPASRRSIVLAEKIAPIQK